MSNETLPVNMYDVKIQQYRGHTNLSKPHTTFLDRVICYTSLEAYPKVIDLKLNYKCKIAPPPK